MGFIKKNAFLLGCALMGIAGMALMLWGMTSMGRVGTEMDQANKLYSALDRATKSAAKPEAIEAEKERFRLVKDHHGKVMAHFAERNVREPLVEGLLPDPGRGPQGKNLRYEFRSNYKQAMHNLLVQLNAGQPPTTEEIGDVTDYLRKKAMEEQGFDPGGDGGSKSGGRPGAGRGRTAVTGGSSSAQQASMPERKGPASTEAYWQALKERAQNDAATLASISKARNLYCYANLRPGGSFELHSMFTSTDDAAPGMADIWMAHLWTWVQQDVVEALARVNERAAAKLEEPWVGNLPVKDILSIRVSDYVVDTGEGPPPRRAESSVMPPQHPDSAYTHLASDPLYDVVNMRIRLAVDVRQIPAILDELCHDRYYAVLNMGYDAVPPDLNFTGKIYGPQPVVVATIDLQTYMFYKSYVPLMPEVIREQLGVPQEQFDSLVEELRGPEDPQEDQPEEEEDDG